MADGSLIFDTKIDKDGINDGIKDIQKNLNKAQSQMVKDLEKTQNAMKKTEAEIDKVSASLDAMYQTAKDKYAGLPGNNQKLIDAELVKNKEYQKSISKIDELNAKYTEQEKECQILTDNINKVVEAKKKFNNEEIKSNKKLPKGTEALKNQSKESNTLAKGIQKLASRFKMLIAVMIMREVIDATKEGFNDLARYSKEFNGTMSELQGAFLQTRNSLATAFAPVLQALTPIITTVTNAIVDLMNVIAQVNTAIFNSSTTFTRAKKVTTDYAKSLKNTNNEAKKTFASFDEIEQLNVKKDNSTGTPEASEMFEEAKINPNITNFIDEMNIKIQPLIDSLNRLKLALEPLSQNVFAGLKWGFDNVLKPLGEFAITEVLPRYLDILASVVKVLNTVLEKFAPLGKDFINNFIKPIAKFVKPYILEFLDDMKLKLQKLNKTIEDSKVFEDLREILDKLYPILAPIAGAILSIQIELAKLGVGVAFNLLVYGFEQLADAIGLVASILNGDFTKAWEHLKDLLIDNRIDLVKNQIGGLKEKFGELETKIGETVTWWKDNIDEMVNSWKTKITNWWNDNVTPWFTKEKWDGVFFQIGVSIANAIVGVGGFVEKWKTNISDWWNKDVKPWFTAEKWGELFQNIADSIAYQFTDENGFLKTWQRSISDWWTNDVAPWFTLDKWKELGGNIKDGVILGIKGAISAIIGVLNSCIDGFQSLVNGAIDSINNVIEGYNSVADVVPGLSSMDPLNHINLDKYKIKVPALATGTVVPANYGNFLATLGDNKRAPEIVSPLPTMVDAFEQVMANHKQDITIKFDGSIGELIRLLKPYIDKENRRVGSSMRLGGAY